MKLSNSLVLLFGILPIMQGSTQGTKEKIKKIKAEIKSDSIMAKSDSLAMVNDSIAGKNLTIVAKFERSASTLESQANQLKKEVQTLIQQKPETVAIVRTKYVPVPETVDKEAYWKRQREYTDSIAKAKKDSIAWKHRGIFKKIFGPKKTPHEKD